MRRYLAGSGLQLGPYAFSFLKNGRYIFQGICKMAEQVSQSGDMAWSTFVSLCVVAMHSYLGRDFFLFITGAVTGCLARLAVLAKPAVLLRFHTFIVQCCVLAVRVVASSSFADTAARRSLVDSVGRRHHCVQCLSIPHQSVFYSDVFFGFQRTGLVLVSSAVCRCVCAYPSDRQLRSVANFFASICPRQGV